MPRINCLTPFLESGARLKLHEELESSKARLDAKVSGEPAGETYGSKTKSDTDSQEAHGSSEEA